MPNPPLFFVARGFVGTIPDWHRFSRALACQYRSEFPLIAEVAMTTPQPLSELEVAIIRALAEGLQSKEIASALERSRPTIEFHIRMLFVKMEARSRAQLVARGYETGLLQQSAAGSASAFAL